MCKTNELPRALQPSAKFDRLGQKNLSDVDLLALILRSGTRTKNTMLIAEETICAYGSLTELNKADVSNLQEIDGIGAETAKVIKAALELGTRLSSEMLPEQPQVASPEEVASIMRPLTRSLDVERFYVLLLNVKNRLVRPPVPISTGTLNSSLVHPREVFRPAVKKACANIILVHNHPSGDPSPSAQDIKITKKLIEAGAMMGIDVLDHIIMGRKMRSDTDDFLSLLESGLVEF